MHQQNVFCLPAAATESQQYETSRRNRSTGRQEEMLSYYCAAIVIELPRKETMFLDTNHTGTIIIII